MKWGRDGDTGGQEDIPCVVKITFYFQVDRPEAKAVGPVVKDG